MNPDQDALRELMECNPYKSTQELALDLNTSQSTICPNLKKIGKMNKLSICIAHTPSEKNKKQVFFQGREITCFQEYYYKWGKMGLLWQCSMQKAMDR